MNILFWTDGFWPRLGGIETQGFELIQEMRTRGHNYLVIAQKDHPDWKDEEFYESIPIKRFNFNAVIAKQELTMIPRIQTYLEEVLKEFKPDIIHLNTSVGGSAFVFFLFKKLFCVPVVFTCHAPYLHENKFPLFVKQLLSSVDQIGCVSRWVFNEIEKYLPLLRSRLQLIYNGLPMPDIIPSPLSFSPPILLLFGRLSQEKGFDIGLQAFSLLKKRGSNARLIVAGGGSERLRLEKLAENLGVMDSVQFTGVLTKEEVLSTYNNATLVIVPSILESFGLVILESMQMARPVVASAVQGIFEVVSDGETGCLVPGQDPEAFFQAIDHLLKNPEKARQMGIKGRQRALEFTIHKNAEQYETLYRECIHSFQLKGTLMERV